MRVYIPFKDGSSISFDGEGFTIHKRPNDINSVDNFDVNSPCQAELVWQNKWQEIVKALENSWKKQKDLKKLQSRKKIYAP